MLTTKQAREVFRHDWQREGGIRAWSLRQPWATAVALELKGVETRDRNCSHRGYLAIHAAASFDADERSFFHRNLRYFRMAGFLGQWTDLPLGKVVAVCYLYDVEPTEQIRERLGPTEIVFGNYTPGRHAYVLDGVQRLKRPEPARGMPGLFTWKSPPLAQRLLEPPTWNPAEVEP